MNVKTKRIVTSALFAAIVCVTTMIIKIPSPLKGYINLGDGVVLLCSWMLPAGYGFLAAGIGSALADVFSGYMIYVPATFIIKGLMALISMGTYKLIKGKLSDFPSRVISAVLAEIVMVLGYLLFEGIIYGFAASLVNVPANAIQGLAGIILAVFLFKALEKSNFKLNL